jgi:hypothetical protein
LVPFRRTMMIGLKRSDLSRSQSVGQSVSHLWHQANETSWLMPEDLCPPFFGVLSND